MDIAIILLVMDLFGNMICMYQHRDDIEGPISLKPDGMTDQEPTIADMKMLIRSGLRCPYCENPTQLVNSETIYGAGRDYGRKFYLCAPCQAWVGCHKGTNKALGRLANEQLRKLKIEAHACLDSLWRRKVDRGALWSEARSAAYRWLSTAMNIHPDECHIGMFGPEDCRRVIDLCLPYLK